MVNNSIRTSVFVVQNSSTITEKSLFVNQTLFLSTLFFADEIVALETLTELPEKESKPSENELKIALQLIESLSSQFQPQKYHNEYHDQLMELIESKAEGETLIVQEPA